MTNHHLPENWSYTLIDSHFDIGDVGIRFRTSRSGPEEDFVSSFLRKLNCQGLPDLELTIFKEPRLETGSPDLVGVIWHRPTAETWDRTRFILKRNDFRLMHYVAQNKSTDHGTIKTLFGKSGSDSVERLNAASMLTIRGEVISSKPLSAIYAVRHIFAIEAKVSAWRMALRQAFLNRWFATSSHVLLPKMPASATIVSEARSLGVSVWSPHVSKLTLNLPSTASTPTSYASWLFNEWAWKVWTRSSRQYAESKHLLLG